MGSSHLPVFGTLTWSIKKDIQEVQRLEPDPGTVMVGKHFVSKSIRSIILDCIHSNKRTCHSNYMHSLTKRHFWQPFMNDDIKEFVAVCTTCAHHKGGNQPPVSLLQSLPSPGHP